MTKGQCSDEGPMLETLDYTIRNGSTPTILYFDLYIYTELASSLTATASISQSVVASSIPSRRPSPG